MSYRDTMRALLLLSPSLWWLVGCAGGGDGKGTADGDDSASLPADTVAPTLTLTAPLDGQTLSGAVDFAAEASDDVGVAEVAFTVDGTQVAVASAEPWSAAWDSTGVINGNYLVGAIATDAAGNSTEVGGVAVVVENDGAPASAVRIINPVDGATLCGDVTVEVAVSEEAAEVTFALDGTALAADSDSPYTWDWNTLATANGSHSVRATATLADGEQVQNTIVVDIENTGETCDNLPNVILTSPEDNAYGYGTVSIAADASDDVGVLKVQFFIDNGLLVEDTSTPYQVDWNSDDFDEGPHIVKAIAYDTASQSAETRTTLTIDRTSPTVEITEPGGGQLDGTVTVSADVTEAIGLASVVLWVDGAEEATFTDGPFTYDWDTTTVDRGSHTLEWVATDRAGHVGADSMTVTVDNPPDVSITSPSDGESVEGQETVSVSARDDGDVESVSFYLDGTRQTQDTSSPFSWTWDTCAASAGAHTIEVTGTDDGGNSVSDSVSVTVDQAAEVELLHPSGTLAESELLAAYAASDERITTVEWDLDGTVVATETATSRETLDSDGINIYGECSLGCSDDCDYYEANLDVTALAEGSYTLRVTVTDASGDTDTDTVAVTVDYDQDGDGHDAEAYGGDDCDDDDATVSPSATETCDGVDEDCDGDTDEDYDADGDGSFSEADCPSTIGDDCDDSDASVFPGATETCDGVDNDCDGLADVSGTESWATSTFGSSSDSTSITGDFYGNVYQATEDTTLEYMEAYLNPSSTITIYYRVYEATSRSGPYTLVVSDSDSISGSAGWYTSGTLDVEITTGRYYLIGTGSASGGDYYYDATPSLTAASGLTPLGYARDTSDHDPASISASPSSSWLFYQRLRLGGLPSEDRDTDGDGVSEFCDDCDDDDASIYPGAAETCDGADDDCDGSAEADEVDADGDGEMVCAGDCDDADDTRASSFSESCDGVDNDCSGAPGSDEVDADGDGVMVCGSLSCEATDTGDTAEPDCTETSADCDDADATAYPGAEERCDGVDDDCDGVVDNDPVDGTTYYADADGDGYGASTAVAACSASSGYTTTSGDCDDTDSAEFPGATEVCDGDDDDCDGSSDEGTDADGDGWGVCEDCDDSNAAVNPAAAEVCDNTVDEDCDGHSPVCVSITSLDLSRADVKLIGETSGDSAGDHVSVVGDVDGDGNDDLMLSAINNDDGGSGAGAVYLVGGPITGDLDLSAADAEVYGESVSDYAGRPWALGDVNGDGFADVLVGVYGDDDGGSDAGAAYVLHGPISSGPLGSDVKLVGEDASDQAGLFGSAGGDIDGDGYDDILVGAPYDDDGGSNAGAVYLVYGPASADLDLSAADAKLIGEDAGDYAGRPGTAGDFDGDGFADVLVGGYEDDSGGTDAGAVYVVYGPISGDLDLSRADLKIVGEDADDHAGVSASTAGDVDNDGYSDLLIGANYDDSGGTDAGAVYLVSGPLSASLDLSRADGKALGENSSDYVGYRTSGSDLDDDGYADTLIGSPYADAGGSNSGSVFLLYGPWSGTKDLTSAADVEFVGEDASDGAGALSTGGDLDGDGHPDLLIGASGDDDGGSGAGAAYIIFSSSL